MPAKTTRPKFVRPQPALPTSRRNPKTSRPIMPPLYGIPSTVKGSVPWGWARDRLIKSHNYLLTTMRPDGRPHSMVVWGVWLDGAFYFSTGATTRKAKNLATNANCLVCNENLDEAVIVEGLASQLAIAKIPRSAFLLYQKKYGWKLDPAMGPVFKVTPRVVFAMPEKLFPAGATRWLFT
jgi:Pyridoxamine 5'-phosphate oxidase